MKSRFANILDIALEGAVMVRALKVALVAGTLYNLINQGEKVACLAFGEINYLKISLTYLMPFLVSTYTAVSMKMAAQADFQQ
jgi:hypothetical protein